MSDETVYFVDCCKRSTQCKGSKCPDKTMTKGTLRIGVHKANADDPTRSITKYYHPICYTLPRQFASGDDKVTALEFLENHCDDRSDGKLEEEGIDVVAEKIMTKQKKVVDLNSPREKVRKALRDEEDGGEPALKKLKSEGMEMTQEKLAVLAKYYGPNAEKVTNDHLKDILGWNHQSKSGVKDVLLAKVVDGELNGRLARCPLDGSRLRLDEDGKHVTCNGSYDEDHHVRVDCHYKTTADKAPRWKPWYTEEPTEEQEKEMKELIEVNSGAASPSKAAKGETAMLQRAVEDSDIVTMWSGAMGRAGMNKATEAFFEAISNYGGSKTLDLPEDRSEAVKTLGPFLIANGDKSPADLVTVLVDQYGFVEDKKASAVKKEHAMEEMCLVPANAPLASILKELANLFFKNDKKFQGIAVNKVVKAIQELKFEVTVDNALKLGKAGKMKVPGIGKGTSQAMDEYLRTGKIEIMDELRAGAT